jgi:membrane-associated phospholipid phosphatase
MLIVYWQAGQFYGTPNQKLQSWLVGFDQRWLGAFSNRFARRWKTSWVGSYFEFAYLFCYALIPLGVGVLYWATLRSVIDEYWSTVLPASYLCYVLVPFAQTLPPRMLRPAGSIPQPRQKIRSFNLFILRHASIHLNTFPSAHVASTIAASLVLIGHLPAVGVVFLLIALSIAAGAVLGFYHYSLDVILGAALGICVRCLRG